MFASRPLRTTAALAALVLSLAACGASQEESPTAGDDGAVEATQPAEDAPAESGEDPADADEGTDPADEEGEASEQEADEDSEEPAGEDDAAGEEAGTLTITLDGEDTTFTPEIVRCNGEPGTIRNAVMTMADDELPLVKVTPGEFAMVKLDQRGAPEKSSSTDAITAEDGTVTFEDAEIGDAVVDGTVTCLQGSQG